MAFAPSDADFNWWAVYGDGAEQKLRVELSIAVGAGAAREALAAVDFCVTSRALVGVAPPGSAAIFGWERFLTIWRAAELFGQCPERCGVVRVHQVRDFVPERDERLVPAVV